MKKRLSIVLALALLVSLSASALADDKPINFTPTRLNGMEWSVSNWTGTSVGRSAFVLLALFDLTNGGGYEVDDFDVASGAIVATMNGADAVMASLRMSNGHVLALVYSPSLHYAFYSIMDTQTVSRASFRDGVTTVLKENSSYSNVQFVSADELLELVKTLSGS